MKAFTTLTAVTAPLLRENIDTDIIVRIERLTAAVMDLEHWCFEVLRYRPDGTPDPAFVLNQPMFGDAQILLAGPNFGCGSSREGAVWALMAIGLRCVIAPGFGDIFFNNCFQNGMLPIVLPEAIVTSLAADIATAAPRHRLTIDLVRQVVVSPLGAEHPFTIAALRKAALVEGLDELGLTMKREPEIAAFEAADRVRRPWIYEPVETGRP